MSSEHFKVGRRRDLHKSNLHPRDSSSNVHRQPPARARAGEPRHSKGPDLIGTN